MKHLLASFAFSSNHENERLAFEENRHRRLSSRTPHMSESVAPAGRSSAEPRLPVRPPRSRDPGPQELPGDPWPRAGERRLGGRAWLGRPGLFKTIASPTPSRKASAPRAPRPACGRSRKSFSGGRQAQARTDVGQNRLTRPTWGKIGLQCCRAPAGFPFTLGATLGSRACASVAPTDLILS